MYTLWKNLCRLCGNGNGSLIDIFVKSDNTHNLSTAVAKYFNITIAETDNLPSKICLMCLETIISIIKYDEQTLKVQQMFLELEESTKLNLEVNISSLRIKYGIDSESHYITPQRRISIEFKDAIKKKFDNQEDSSTSIDDQSIIDPILKVEVIDDENECYDPNNYNADDNVCKKELKNVIMKFDEPMDYESELDRSYKAKKDEEYIKEEDNISDAEKRFECRLCKERFDTSKSRTLHLKNIHSTNEGQSSYNCSSCNKVFKKFRNLKIHELTHLPSDQRKLFSCSHCDKKFTNEWYIDEHIRIVHKRERPYICEICGSTFGSNRNLIDHRLTHSEEKKFQCTKCSKTFKCKRALKLHTDIHDDTQYICPVCGIQLNTKRILRRHMIVHSNLSKYKCNFCLKEFKRTDAFKNHLILHTGIKPYQCPFCELTFANGSNCRKHERTTHPAEVAAADLVGKPKIAKNVPGIKQLKAKNEEALIETSKNLLNTQK